MFISNDPELTVIDRQKVFNLEDNIVKCTKRYIESLLYTAPLINQKEKYIYVLDLWRGLFVSDITPIYTQEIVNGDEEIDMKQIITQSQVLTLQITLNQKQIILGFRTQGINIYDISDRKKPFLLQSIPSIGASTKVSLSNSETKLIYCNGQKLKIYQQMIPNLSANIPNFFNGLQGKLIDDDTTIEEKVPWRMVVSQDSKWLYVAGGRNGAQIFSLEDPNTPKFITSVPVDEIYNPTDGITISPDGNTLLVGEGFTGVKIVDVTDKLNYKVQSTILFEGGDSDDQQFSNDMNYMVVGHGVTGVSVVDISDHYFPELVSTWVLDKTIGQVENVLFNNANTQIWASLRFYGVIVLEFNPYIMNMKVIGDHWNGNTEMIQLSNDEQFGFFCDGNVGIRVANITDVSNIQEIKIVELGGFPGKLRKIQYQNKYDYLFVSQQDSELLSCVNVTDPINSEVILKYDIESDIAYDVDCTKDKEYCYMITNNGIQVLPLKNQLDIHKEFRLIQDGQVKEKFEGTQLPIGKQIQVILIPLRSGGKIQINKLYHYKNFLLEEIPSYMYFDRSSLSLTINVNKEGLNQGQQFQNNIIQIQLSKQILEDTFVNEALSITYEQSLYIRQAAIVQGYLNKYFFINPDFNTEEDLFINHQIDENEISNFQFSNNIVEYIRSIFINSIIQIPLALNFAQSLFFKPYETDNKIITTESDILNIKIEILDKKTAEFVIIPYTGALVDSQLFMMTGSKDLVLQILTNKLIVQDYQPRQNIKINIQIDDTINHVQKYTTDYEECQFLKLHQGIIQNQEQSLQQQFDKDFDGGIYIQDDFVFQFADSTFKSSVELQIQYKILFKFPGSEIYEEPDNGSWLQVNLLERKIEGYPPTSLYKETINVQVFVSDGYDEIQETFDIKINKIPGYLILQIVIGITSPIITIIGLIQYRGILYGIFCKSLYKDGKIFVKNGENFQMQLILGKDQIILMNKIYKKFKKQLKNDKKTLTEYINLKNYQINTKDIVNNLINIIQNNTQFQTKQYEDIDILTDLQNSQDHHYLFSIIKCFMFYDIIRMQCNSQSFQYYKIIKNFLQNTHENKNQWFQSILKVEYTDVDNCQEVLPIFKFNMVRLDQLLRSISILKHIQQIEIEVKEIQKKYDNLNGCCIANSKRNAKHSLYYTYESEFFQEIIGVYQKYCKFDSINLRLIFQTIITDNIGFKNQKWLKYSNGLTLNCEIKDIFTIAALTKSNRWYVRMFPSISKFLNIDYQDIPMVTNSPLPEWLQYNYHHDIVEIQGIWDSKDENDVEIMIRIININQITVKEFIIYRIYDSYNIQKYGETYRHSLLVPTSPQLLKDSQNIETPLINLPNDSDTQNLQKQIILLQNQLQQKITLDKIRENSNIEKQDEKQEKDQKTQNVILVSPKFASVNKQQVISINQKDKNEINQKIFVQDKENSEVNTPIHQSNQYSYCESSVDNFEDIDQKSYYQIQDQINSKRQLDNIIQCKQSIMPNQNYSNNQKRKQNLQEQNMEMSFNMSSNNISQNQYSFIQQQESNRSLVEKQE